MYDMKGLTKTDFNGIMTGLVIDNADPKLEGRVAVMIPKLMTPNRTEFQASIRPNTETPLGKAMIKNNKENPYFQKIQVVNFYWARNSEMIDSAPGGDWIKTNKKVVKPDATNTHQLAEVGIETHYLPMTGSVRVPRVGTYVWVIFIDNDPQKCYYLPFGPTLQGEAIPMHSLEPESKANAINPNRRPNINVIREWMNGNIIYADTNHNVNTFVIKFADPIPGTKPSIETGPKIKMKYSDSGNFTQILTRTKHELMMFDCEKYCQMQTCKKNTTRWDDKDRFIITYTTDGHYTRYDDKNEYVETKTVSGHYMRYDDKNQYIEIKTKQGHTIRMDDKSDFIQVTTKQGQTILMDDPSDTITISTIAKGTVKLTKECACDIYNFAHINLTAGSDINLVAPNINLKGIILLDGPTTVTSTLSILGAVSASSGVAISGGATIDGDAVIDGISFDSHTHTCPDGGTTPPQ